MTTFRKHRRDAPPGFFRVEAAGLAWLAEAGGVRVAGVADVGDDFIELEHLPHAAPSPDAAVAFGRDLARTHDAGAASFGCPPPGWDGPGYIGDAPLPWADSPTWGRFYADARVRPYLDDAGLAPQDRATLERLADVLDTGAFDDAAPPARIHGDLWSGNALFTRTSLPSVAFATGTSVANAAEGSDVAGTEAGAGTGARAGTGAGDVEVALIDPAAHGGHRVTDLAMLALFGTPHLATVLTAYERASHHLPPGWRDLMPLHQVHPLLVHAVLFGGGYARQAARAAEQALVNR